jgi:hypothetical protein
MPTQMNKLNIEGQNIFTGFDVKIPFDTVNNFISKPKTAVRQQD